MLVPIGHKDGQESHFFDRYSEVVKEALRNEKTDVKEIKCLAEGMFSKNFIRTK